MSIRNITDRTTWLLAALSTAACGGQSATPNAENPEPGVQITDVQRFLPFEEDSVSAFETFSENTGEKGVLMMHISRPRPDSVELSVGGKVQRLSIVREGVQLATGGWLLKAPLEAGSRFKGQFGDVRVTSIDKQIEVPAGRFSGCLETVEENQVAQRKVTTVFCPKVGIVSLEAEGKLGDDEYGHERAVLRSHAKRVDISTM